MPFITRKAQRTDSDILIQKNDRIRTLDEALQSTIAKATELRIAKDAAEAETEQLQGLHDALNERFNSLVARHETLIQNHDAYREGAAATNIRNADRIASLEQTGRNQARENQKLETFLENLLELEPSLKRFLVPDTTSIFAFLSKAQPQKPVWDFEAVTRVIGLRAAKNAAAADEALADRLSAPVTTPPRHEGAFVIRGGRAGVDFVAGDKVEVYPVAEPIFLDDDAALAKSKANHPAGKGKAKKKARFTESAA